MSAWVGTWDDWSIEILGSEEVGAHVFVAARQRGRGKSTAAPVEGDLNMVFTVRHGKIARWQMLRSEQQAREAMGMAG